MKKRLIAILFSVTLCLVSIVSYSAMAVEPLYFQLENCIFEDGSLFAVCNTNAITAIEPKHITGTLGNAPLTVKDVTSYDKTAYGTTYLFLIDTDSLDDRNIQTITAAVEELCKTMQVGDNAGIMFLGKNISAPILTDDSERIHSFLDSMQGTKDGANLYAGIKDALSFLQSSNDTKTKRCLIVMSDGQDSATSGITREEAEKAVMEANVPVIAVNLTDDDADAETIKVFGSFGRMSPGGGYFGIEVDNATPAQLVAKMAALLKQSIYVTLIPQTPIEGNVTDTLALTLAIPEGKVQTTMQVNSVVNPNPPEPTPIPEPTPDHPIIAFFLGLPVWAYCVAGGAFLLLVLVIVISARKKHQKRMQDNSKTVGYPVSTPYPYTVSTQSETDNGATVPIFDFPEYEVALEPINGCSPNKYTVIAKDTLIVGRATDANLVIDHPKVSSKHFRLDFEGNDLFISDLHSTNGTYINGYRLSTRQALHCGDKVRMGDTMEFRVLWKKA